ncbi:hypothetical protein ACFE04_019954 [Oxalis oulophora]
MNMMINSSSALATSSSSISSCFINLKNSSTTPFSPLGCFNFKYPSTSTTRVKAVLSSSSSFSSNNNNNTPVHPILDLTVKSLRNAALFVAVTAFMIDGFPRSRLPAMADSSPAAAEAAVMDQEENHHHHDVDPVSEFLDSNIDTLKSLMHQKLQNGEDEGALNILKRILSVQPHVTEWKFLMARLLNEMGQTEEARKLFEEILVSNPLSFEALFENALLMDRCGEGEAVIRRLEEALIIAQEDNKLKEARDVRLIMAQIHFLQKNVDDALITYQQLAKEDPRDFRPYFCQGMIYSLLDRNNEAKEMFAKYRQLAPNKFEVQGYLRTPLSKMKVFGTAEDN